MRLIDADALQWSFKANGSKFYGESRIKNAPTIDAVQVVRCRDCMHGREQNAEEKVVSQLLPEILICNHPDVSEYCWQGVWPNHFCSYGERREEG